MKKIFYIIATALMLSACCETEEANVYTSECEREFVQILYDGNWGIGLQVFRFEYGGHKYILFGGYETKNGIVHDPDCPCHTVETPPKTETSDYPSWW